VTALPDWIAAQLPAGARDHDIATRGERMHAMVWEPTPRSNDAPHLAAEALPTGGPEHGHTLVMMHGNPTWGFLWRRVIAELRARPGGHHFRIVVPDLVGLGRSSKPAASEHTLEHHAAWLGDVLDELAPGPLVIVAQDWGGPISLLAMADRLPRLRGIVLGNTVAGPPKPGFKQTLFHRLAHAPTGRVLFEWLGFPLRQLHFSQGDRSSIRGDVARAYRWPLAKRVDRAAPLALARMVPNTMEHPSIAALRRTEEVFRTAQVPISLVWGMKDPVLGRAIGHLERLRPDAKVTRTGAGHFLQEEVPKELVDAIVDVAGRADWS
jgi:haloalkane dehalogenase